MNNSRTASFLFFALLAVISLTASLFVMGCKSNSTSPSPSSMPNPGSTLTVRESTFGNIVTIAYTVFATTVTNPNTSGGKVIGLSGLRSDNNQYDTMYWSYETNGDISIYPNPSTNGAWWTLPFVSQGNNKSSYSTGQPDPSFDTTSISGSGAGASFSLGGQTYNTDSVTAAVTQLYTQTPPAVISLFHFTYLPAIGIIGIIDADNGSQDVVTSYTSK